MKDRYKEATDRRKFYEKSWKKLHSLTNSRDRSADILLKLQVSEPEKTKVYEYTDGGDITFKNTRYEAKEKNKSRVKSLQNIPTIPKFEEEKLYSYEIL